MTATTWTVFSYELLTFQRIGDQMPSTLCTC